MAYELKEQRPHNLKIQINIIAINHKNSYMVASAVPDRN